MKTDALIAYHGDPATKAKYVARMRTHIEADQLVQGTGFDRDTGRGCAVGCTLDRYDHKGFEGELEVPEVVARLLDVIFEGLPEAEAQPFALEFLEAIEPGADLSLAANRWSYWLMTNESIGLAGRSQPDGKAAIVLVAGLHERTIRGDQPTQDDWSAAWSAAARSAACSAESAASAAESAAAWPAYRLMAIELIRILRDTPGAVQD